jgi:hypothetical protein
MAKPKSPGGILDFPSSSPPDPLPPPALSLFATLFGVGHLLRCPQDAAVLLDQGQDAPLAIARELRIPGIPLLDWLADALDPTTQSEWRLEFTKARGRPRQNLLGEFESYREHYRAHGVRGPAERAYELLAERHGMDPSVIKRQVTRERKSRTT